ncbi:MAG: AraC family transcriptional regulator [Planctomycetota bacterium]|jgi:AraC-like DNA-binding protein|nr:AraC family transcriptional regulator [Planctomycetota bacterium]
MAPASDTWPPRDHAGFIAALERAEAAFSGRVWLGSAQPCSRRPGDPPLRIHARPRFNLLMAGTRRVVSSVCGHRDAHRAEPGDVHLWAAEAYAAEAVTDRFELLGVVFHPRHLRVLWVSSDGRSRPGTTPYFVHTASVAGAALAVMRSLEALAARGDPTQAAPDLLRGLLRLLRAHLLADQQPRRRGAAATWARVRAHLEEHVGEPLDRDDVAAAYGLSASYLSELCRREHGTRGFRGAVEAIRIERAQCLLRRDDLSVKQVAVLCGFASEAYFGRVFKKVVGVSPGRWR